MDRMKIALVAVTWALCGLARAQGAAEADLPRLVVPPPAARTPVQTPAARATLPLPAKATTPAPGTARATTPEVVIPQPRPVLFAPASAASARRLTPEQRDEWRFLKDASAASRLEADASRLALAKSTNGRVREAATAMLHQHAEAGPYLQQALHVRHMAAPMLSNDQRKLLNRLGKLGGSKFDREYLEAVAVGSQQESIVLYERAGGAVGDPALKDWIARSLPTMRTQMASASRGAAPAQRVARTTER